MHQSIQCFLIFFGIHQIAGISYNLPILCPNASWNDTGLTVWNHSTGSQGPFALFVNTENILFSTDHVSDKVLIWNNGVTNRTISAGNTFTSPRGIFVTETREILVSDDISSFSYPIYRWSYTGIGLSTIWFYTGSCFGIFIDTNNYFYCTQRWQHRINRFPVNDTNTVSTTIAGTGIAGSASNQLNGPRAIFVSLDNKLYVADTENHRIQVFQLGQINGKTVIGTGSNESLPLNFPTWVTLDGLGYLFIADSNNHRIIGSDRHGFRCLIGCSGTSGSGPNQLNYPRALAFDTYGNFFVADYSNNRIQKFILRGNLCDETTTSFSRTEKPTIAQTLFSTGSSTASSTQQLSSTERVNIVSTQKLFGTMPPITSSTQQLSNMTTINLSCTAPTITLIPSTSSFQSPIQFRRNQDFYLSATIQFHCNDSLPFQMQWLIINCTSSICTNPIQLDSSIIPTFADLYIPSRTLPFGLFELKFTVTMNKSLSTMSAYVQINPSGITANLVRLGTSMITRGYDQDLQLNPGLYSIDTDGYPFNASDWKYIYFCRIYGVSNFPHIQGVLLSIDDPALLHSNTSCFDSSVNSGTHWRFDGVTQSIKSSVTILSKSLRSNRTYQWMVYMENKRNNSLQATGYLLVEIVDTRPQMIVIGCVISILCVPNLEFQLVNPTTQVALYALCLGQCSYNHSITWNVYEGSANFSSNITRWTPFNQTNAYRDIWFFGGNTSNFTAINQLFLANSHIDLWRFEVVYSFANATSSSSLNFIINQPPSNGSCSIFPMNGTTSTLFTISCPDWFDADDVKDYSLYTKAAKPSERILIGFSIVSTFSVRLPRGTNQNDELELMIYIRDRLDCVTEFQMSSVIVKVDSQIISTLINQFQSSSSSLTQNPVVQLLKSGNQNIVNQVLVSISQQFNQLNSQMINETVASGVSAATISIGALGSTKSSFSGTLNQSAVEKYTEELNLQASIREYLIGFTTNLSIATANSLKMQSKSLAELTQSTNQLTRTTLIIASDRCFQLSNALRQIVDRISFEDVQMIVTQLVQCGSNLLTAVNAPLQQRTIVLEKDFLRSTEFPTDYETDLEFEWSNLNLFPDGNRNVFYQKQLAKQMISKMNEMIELLTDGLNVHLNLGQNFQIDRPSIFTSFQIFSSSSIQNEKIYSIGDAQIRLRSSTSINSSSSISLRSTVEPLALFGDSNTNFSRSISLTLTDKNGKEIPLRKALDHPFELLIPRDPQMEIPPMFLQNVTKNSSTHRFIFNFHFIDIKNLGNVSVHFEFRSLNKNLSYLLIYRFDRTPILNGSISQIDGWTLFCSSTSKNFSSLFTFFIDNLRTSTHSSVIFGVRELNSTEVEKFCSNFTFERPPMSENRYSFTSNYEIRLYTSSCLYLDDESQWRSDGLRVGPLTNLSQTHCISLGS